MNTTPTPATPPPVPTQPGLWWRDDHIEPVSVGWPEHGLLWWNGEYWESVTADGHWLGPCLTPSEQRERLGKLAEDYDERSTKCEDEHTARALWFGANGVRASATALGITLEGGGK